MANEALKPVAEVRWSGRKEGGKFVQVYGADIFRLTDVGSIPDGTKLYAIPEGWALVPVEPTREMIEAGYRIGDAPYAEIFRVMVEDAPKPSN